jgi:hypothetical protein
MLMGYWSLVIGHWGAVSALVLFFKKSIAAQRLPKFLISHFSFLIKTALRSNAYRNSSFLIPHSSFSKRLAK